uniref:Folliculin n=1 Tax=Caenorhabditis tropicalis TaxID=1561998 RepID=A0A1I7TAC2_9PELO
MTAEKENPKKNLREAGEVFLFMHRIFRASRNLRAHWYIDHLGKPIRIREVPQESTSPPPDPNDEYSQEMTVIGIVPVGGDRTEIVGDEEFIITVKTKCTYISRYYRMVFVLDLSPSVVVADDESNCCLVDRVIPSLQNALRSSVKSFIIPGTNELFRPQVFTTICVFSPFMKFEESFTLCQGVFVTESNVNTVIQSVETKFVDIYKRLFTFSRPILELWGKLKRRHKHNKFDSLCEGDSMSDDNFRRNASNEDIRVTESPAPSSNHRGRKDPKKDKIIDGGNIMTIKRGVWAATEKHEDTKQLSFPSDKSYVAPDWSMIFMLRMGLLHIQMLPENTQSNLIIISDSVCGMPDEGALQNVLTQLRSYTVALSFIQLQKKACTEPVFGHVGSSSLFYFMTMATFGTYLPRQKQKPPQPPLILSRTSDGQLVIKRSVEPDDIIDECTENINQFHRALICWSFQNGLNENDYLLDTFRQINSDFLALQQSHVDRHRRFVANYNATLNRMMYVRLREGFTLKSTVFVNNNTQVILTLRLAFRPLVFIDYIITSAWPVNKNVHQEVNVELVLEGPYNELKDLLTESNYLNPIRMNLIKSVVDGIIDADRLLLHIHSFDTKRAYFTIPPGVTTEYALFQQGDTSRQILPQLCIVRPDVDKTRGFVNFWNKMLEVDDGNWQKWVHTQTERCVMNLMQVPFEMFSYRRVLTFDTRYPLNAIQYTVKVRATFCLVENQTYVTLIYASENAPKPSYFFIRKIITNGPVAIVKTAFLGGVTSIARRRAVEAQRQRMINVTFGATLNEENLQREALRFRYEANAAKLYMDPVKIMAKKNHPACKVFRRPLERMVVRYNHVPSDLTTIVRAEERTDDADEIKLLTLHNTLAKSLACRRSVIILNTFQPGGAFIVRLLAEFCQNVLMHKRVNKEGFRPAWTQNNTVSLLRQVYDSSGPSLEQFIMFPAITVQPDILGKPILRRKNGHAPKYDPKECDEFGTMKNILPSRTNVETLAIICEMWNEPEGGNPDDQLANMSAERRLNEDLRFISVLFTLDRICRHGSQLNDNFTKLDILKGLADPQNLGQMFPYTDRCKCTTIHELTGIPKKTPLTPEEATRQKNLRRKSKKRTETLKTQMDFEKEWELEQQGLKDTPKPPTPGMFPIRYIKKKAEGEEEILGELDEPFPYVADKEMLNPTPTITDIHADAVSKFVTVYDNLFSMTNLIYHAQRRYCPLPHFVIGSGEQDMPRCNALQLNALHCQLSEITDLTWIIHETEEDIVFADLVKTIPEAERPPQCRLRVYVKVLTTRMAALIFVPVTKAFNPHSELIPMFILTVHETQIAHCYAQDAFDEHGIVTLPMSDIPNKWDSRARYGWTPHNRNVFPEEATTFSSFCEHFEMEILPRIRIRAIYEAAQEEIPLNEDRLMDMSADVDCLELEMSTIPVVLRDICKHLDPFSRASPEDICCKGSNIEYLFDKTLLKNFKKVNGTQTMFYLNLATPEQNTKKREQNKGRSRGNSGMMYVDGGESNNSLSEVGGSEDGVECGEDAAGKSEKEEEEEEEEDSDETETGSSDGGDDSDTLSEKSDVAKKAPSSSSSSSDDDDDGEEGKEDNSPPKLGEDYVEYAGTNQPMFIQFNCSVNFDDRVNSFPISFLPTCVHELLPFIENPPTDPEDISNVEIVLELVVLTTQSLRPKMDIYEMTRRTLAMARSHEKNPYEFERHRRESYKKEQEAVAQSKSTEDEYEEEDPDPDPDAEADCEDEDENEDGGGDDDEEKEEKKKKKGGDELFDLPARERKVMTDLVRNLEVILKLERILLESRKENVTEELLENVKLYIAETCTKSNRLGHTEVRLKPFVMVENSESKIKEFMDLVENRECEYLKVLKLKGTKMFYCKSIVNHELYHSIKTREARENGQDRPSIGSEDYADFWIIITVGDAGKNISLHFCERNEGQHTAVMDKLWAGVRQDLRILNQGSLLERMYTLREIDELMVPEYKSITQFDENEEDGLTSRNAEIPPKPKATRLKPKREDLPHDLYYYFSSGYYACPLQYELWIPVPERCRNQSMLVHKNPLHTAFEKFKPALLKFGVHNRNNTYVYKDEERNQIFYFQMHMDRDSYQFSVKGAHGKLRRKQIETIDKMLESKICVTIFGISVPHSSIIQMIWDALNEKLEALLFLDIMRGYSQNQEQPLLINEIGFLQPKEPPPQIRKFFSIPFIFQEYLPSLLYFINQHNEALTNISPAKVKDQGIFYNGAAFNRAPVVTNWGKEVRKRSFRLKIEETQQNDAEDVIDIGIEAKEPILRQYSMEEKERERERERQREREQEQPEPLDPATIFKAYPPITGELPPNYLLSSFFVYHILPARGVVDTGIALIEFRMTKPDGSLISRFDQPSMNEQSHDLLVPNVPDDKALVYRDIIKSHTCSKPKPDEKPICAYLEMIVWVKGDVDETVFEKMMYELIEMSMFDVITEFGYLNTTIVEEGVLTAHVSYTNRNSDVFLPAQDSTETHPPTKHLTKQGSASSVTASVDTRHSHTVTNQSGEVRRSLVLNHGPGSLDIGPNAPNLPPLLPPPPPPHRPAAARMSSLAKDIEHTLTQNEISLRRQDYMSPKNAYSIIKWMDYVASKQGETNSVTKQRIRFEFQHASLPALFEIRNRLEVSLGGIHESEIRERVYLCGLRHPSADRDSHAGISLRESSLSIFGTTPHDGRFEVLTTDPFHAMTEDIGVDESKNQEEYILVSCIRNVFDGYGENMIRTKSQVEEMKLMFRNHLHGRYSPLVQTHMYSPRQRIMMAYLKGDFMTIYFYNYHSNIHKDAIDCMNKIVGFHNAKSRLLREIGLHKMGITHLSPFHTEPTNEYDYEVLIWTDPMTLISKEFPMDHKPPPAFMREPQCSNIFFRMYRQPDLQDTMGRSKTLFKSDCVRTMHYEQLLRWRSGLKTKLDFIQKVTRAHVDMINKVPAINEADLLMFLRPPKVARKLGPPPTHTSSTSSVRHRHFDDDHHTEDNNSMTERTSKRASIYGESIKSMAAAESEIFKGKGEFVKKTELKLGLAANKFHEIRTPFFLRSEWNKDAPRRTGELFDEVVRESDIRSLLEEPLKEFTQMYELQQAKTAKQFVKRKKPDKTDKEAPPIEPKFFRMDVIYEDWKDGEEKVQVPAEEEWSDLDSDSENEENEEDDDTKSSTRDGAESVLSNVESNQGEEEIKEEDFERTYGKVRRTWKVNPQSSPAPMDSSRHNSISSASRQSSESGTIEKVFNFTMNAASKLTRKLSRKPSEKEREPSIDKGEDPLHDMAPSPEPIEMEEIVMEPPPSPIMYKHAEEFARYFTRKYGFIQFQVENRNRRSKALNRYTTNSTIFSDLPYLVFYKAYEGGVIFADLKYEIPEFVVSFYMYERAKSSSADYYMVDQMEALYFKESEELHLAAKQLKGSVCFMTFNFDYHLRAVATYIEAKANKKKCLFGTSMNVFHLVERLLDFYQHELILPSNLVAINFRIRVYDKKQNDAILAKAELDRNLILMKMEKDPVTDRRYAGTPIQDSVCKITETTLCKTNHPIFVIEMTGLLSSFPTISGRQCSRVVPSIKLRVLMDDDFPDGELWPPAEHRKFVEDFEGKQRRRLLENMSNYGTEHLPTAWEDSCVRRTVKEMMKPSSSSAPPS